MLNFIKMFESFLEKILNSVIGQFVEGIDKEDMKVGLFSGKVEIKNLKLKAQILKTLKVPFTLKFGGIEKLNLVVPWKSLSSSAVVAELEGLYVVISPSSKGGGNQKAGTSWSTTCSRASTRGW